jgi:TRAP-type C4-dicarboxylate transport system permease small subunit
MKALKRIVEALNRGFGIVGCVALAALTALAIVNMISRAVFTPVPGSYELIGFLCAVAAAMGLGYTQLAKGHVAVTIVTDMFSPRANRVLEGVSHLVSAAFFCLAAWQTVRWGTGLARAGELSETLKIPFFPVVYAAALGLAMLALTLLIDFITLFDRREARQ